MNKEEQVNQTNDPEGISVSDFVARVTAGLRYAGRKWLTIVLISLAGALAGLSYSIFQRPTYTAECTFVLEETSKLGGLSQYAGLASLAGINISGTGGGLFEGDNIIELYKSRSMIERALLNSANFNGKNELLIDRYIDYYGLRKKWRSRDDIDSIIFTGDPGKFNRKQDSIISDLAEKFNKKYLTVVKPDKKLSIVDVSFNSKDELFAREFVNKLVQDVNDFYIQTKTKKTAQNVAVLQHQADSVKAVLDASINGVATASDENPNPNPLLLTLRVPSQKKQVDVQASGAVYGEIVKNLEISKISLRQEIPLIQIIDQPILPLKNDRLTKTAGVILGFVLSGFAVLVVMVLKKAFFS
ncbi:MAG TPA: hypothetical protein VHB54_13095 [Mucilaginibacter sp.]|nr:hypothetical protein [Mucilaginibacter sp.]